MSSDFGRLIAIGDVHGCVHALEAILSTVTPFESDHLVFLGDMIDKGRNTREVLDLIIDLQSQCRVTLIQGNHEEMLFASRESTAARESWEVCGGVNMLNSYRFGGTLSDIPDRHWELLSRCIPYFETDKFMFTHANYLPDEPLSLTPGHILRWYFFEPEEALPHRSGKRVIVGHTETPDSEICDLGFAMCIDTGCIRNGWLTAIDVKSGQTWQASRWGILREPGEPRPLLPPSFRTTSA